MLKLGLRKWVGIGGAVLGAALIVMLNAPSSSSAGAGTTHQVVIENFEFTPASLTIEPGDSVEWVNLDVVPHTATDDDGEWDTDELVNGASTTITFTSSGELAYFCFYHPNMRGEIIIAAE